MTMRTSYVDTSLKNAYILTTGGRHVVHSMDVAWDFQLYRKEIWVRVQMRASDDPWTRHGFLDHRLRKYEVAWSTIVRGRFTIVSREMAAN